MLPLFIDDGYTATATVKAGERGMHPEFTIRYRPIVGAERSEWLHEHERADASKRLEMCHKLVAERCLDVGGHGKLDIEKAKTLNDNALFAIRDYVMLLNGEAVKADEDAQKN